MPKDQKNIFQLINPKDPFQWLGLILLILGITQGGAIGGGLGAAVCIGLISIGANEEYSLEKKLLFALGLTVGGFGLYFVLVQAVFYLINQ